MRRVWTILLTAALLTGVGGCQPGGDSSAAAGSAQRARELYDRAQFRESHELLRQTLSHAGPSVVLLYNFGCALFRDGRLGDAIAAWESARILAPRDPDIRHNLQIAAARQIDKLPEVERSAVARFLEDSLQSVSLDEWTIVVFAVYAALLAAIAMRLLLRNPMVRDSSSTVLFCLSALLLVSLSAWGYSWASYHRARAVVVAPEVTLTSGPDGSGEKIATVHAGLQVEVTGTAGQDKQVRLATGWLGYLPSNSIQTIGLDVWKRTETTPAP